ncbi:MAG: amidohydrolase family protein, partial [Chloroflexota bacterium]|nr:amidohydrolase family protein [Chloroflexota bacterium]
MFDTLITNGTIIDGSNKKSYKGDIGIIGEKIETIGVLSNAESKETINAKDSIVCPGFIDVHSHDDFKILSERRITHNILQGITTMIVGNCGFGI